VLSEERWDGETGLVHDVAGRLLCAEDLGELDAYMCGPPPMIDAATELLRDDLDVPDERIHHDKFTVAADAATEKEVPT
jgi:propane monooxygenase reductase subunit